MALVQTTLSAAVGVNDLVFPVTSATGFTAKYLVKVDNEFCVVDPSYVSGTNIPVFRRGDNGSRAVAHNALAIVVVGTAADWTALGTYQAAPVGDYIPDVVTYSVSGAITVPKRNTTVILDKAGVAVMTLAAPAKDQDGLELWVTSVTANAHTITATSLLADGASGSPHTTATFAAYKGAGVLLVAEQGLWSVKANNGVTIS